MTNSQRPFQACSSATDDYKSIQDLIPSTQVSFTLVSGGPGEPSVPFRKQERLIDTETDRS